MTHRPPETLHELLNLLRPSLDESTSHARDLGQPVNDGPYRDDRETLDAQLKEETARLAAERALLDERAALLEAIRLAHAPSRMPRRFARTLLLGAVLGTTSTLTTLGLIAASQLGHSRPLVVMPPSSWREHADVSAAHRDEVHDANANVALTGPLERSVTRLNETVWDIDRRVLRDPRLHGFLGDLRVVPDDVRGEPLGARLYGVRRGSLTHLLGLENGDTLLAVNGVLVERATLRHFALGGFDDVSRIELALLRRGEPITFTYLLR